LQASIATLSEYNRSAEAPKLMSVPARESSEEPTSPVSELSAELSPESNSSGAYLNSGSNSEFQFLSDGGVLSALAQVVMTSVGADGLALAYALDGTFVCRASCGTNAPPVGTRVNLNSGIAAQCIREGTTVICGDTESDQRVNQEVCRSLGVRSIVAVPLRYRGEIVGLAQAFFAQANGFSSAGIAELESSSELFISCLPNTSRGEAVAAQLAEPQVVDVPESSGAVSSSVSAWAEEIDRLLEQRGFKPPSTDPAEVPQVDDSSPAIFTELRQPLWWKKPTTLAIGVAVLCVLLWVGLRAAISGAADPATTSAEVQQPQSDQTPPTSVAELLKQAQAGDREAQLALAQRYQAGNGVSRNLRKAYAWYIISGEAGSDAARQQSRSLTTKFTDSQIAAIRFEVGEMYAQGIGAARRDHVAAYKWFVLAEAAGDKRAPAELKKLAASMRQSEVQEARSRASDWLSGRRPSLNAAKSTSR
jgi:putative methionine-R-sulfoxide reductase with GAF domain